MLNKLLCFKSKTRIDLRSAIRYFFNSKIITTKFDEDEDYFQIDPKNAHSSVHMVKDSTGIISTSNLMHLQLIETKQQMIDFIKTGSFAIERANYVDFLNILISIMEKNSPHESRVFFTSKKFMQFLVKILNIIVEEKFPAEIAVFFNFYSLIYKYHLPELESSSMLIKKLQYVILDSIIKIRFNLQQIIGVCFSGIKMHNHTVTTLGISSICKQLSDEVIISTADAKDFGRLSKLAELVIYIKIESGYNLILKLANSRAYKARFDFYAMTHTLRSIQKRKEIFNGLCEYLTVKIIDNIHQSFTSTVLDREYMFTGSFLFESLVTNRIPESICNTIIGNCWKIFKNEEVIKAEFRINSLFNLFFQHKVGIRTFEFFEKNENEIWNLLANFKLASNYHLDHIAHLLAELNNYLMIVPEILQDSRIQKVIINYANIGIERDKFPFLIQFLQPELYIKFYQKINRTSISKPHLDLLDYWLSKAENKNEFVLKFSKVQSSFVKLTHEETIKMIENSPEITALEDLIWIIMHIDKEKDAKTYKHFEQKISNAQLGRLMNESYPRMYISKNSIVSFSKVFYRLTEKSGNAFLGWFSHNLGDSKAFFIYRQINPEDFIEEFIEIKEAFIEKVMPSQFENLSSVFHNCVFMSEVFVKKTIELMKDFHKFFLRKKEKLDVSILSCLSNKFIRANENNFNLLDVKKLFIFDRINIYFMSNEAKKLLFNEDELAKSFLSDFLKENVNSLSGLNLKVALKLANDVERVDLIFKKVTENREKFKIGEEILSVLFILQNRFCKKFELQKWLNLSEEFESRTPETLINFIYVLSKYVSVSSLSPENRRWIQKYFRNVVFNDHFLRNIDFRILVSFWNKFHLDWEKIDLLSIDLKNKHRRQTFLNILFYSGLQTADFVLDLFRNYDLSPKIEFSDLVKLSMLLVTCSVQNFENLFSILIDKPILNKDKFLTKSEFLMFSFWLNRNHPTLSIKFDHLVKQHNWTPENDFSDFFSNYSHKLSDSSVVYFGPTFFACEVFNGTILAVVQNNDSEKKDALSFFFVDHIKFIHSDHQIYFLERKSVFYTGREEFLAYWNSKFPFKFELSLQDGRDEQNYIDCFSNMQIDS